MASGMMTQMLWLLLLMGASLALVAVTLAIVLCLTQTQWMKAFGEQHGIQTLNTGVKKEETPLKPDTRPRMSVPVPGAQIMRQVLKANGDRH